MGEILTNTDPFIRAKGAHVLASVINSSGSSASTGVGKANGKSNLLQPTPNATHRLICILIGSVLLNFLLDRMYDKPSVPYILDALTGLVQGEAILKVDLLEIPKRMFAELTVQSFQHTVRYTALRLLDLVLENNLDGLVKTMNNEFLFGYIQALDGEKDPRNLMLAFKTIAVLAAKFDCSRYAEVN